MESVKNFLQRRLRLKVNEQKSAVAPASVRKFLGFAFWWKTDVKIGIAGESVKKAKARIRHITGRTRGISLETMIKQLNQFTTGWAAYFKISEGTSMLKSMDVGIRRRFRCFKIKQWKKSGRTRFRERVKLGLGKEPAAMFAGSRKGWRNLSIAPQISMALSPAYFERQGLVGLYKRHMQLQSI